MKKAPLAFMLILLICTASCTEHKLVLQANKMQHEQVLTQKNDSVSKSACVSLLDTIVKGDSKNIQFADNSFKPETRFGIPKVHHIPGPHVKIYEEDNISMRDTIPRLPYPGAINYDLYERFRLIIPVLVVFGNAALALIPIFPFPIEIYFILSLLIIAIGLGLILFFSARKNEELNPDKLKHLANTIKDFGIGLLLITGLILILLIADGGGAFLPILPFISLALTLFIYGLLYNPNAILKARLEFNPSESEADKEFYMRRKKKQSIVSAITLLCLAVLEILFISDPVLLISFLLLFLLTALLTFLLFKTSRKNDEGHIDYLNYLARILRVCGRVFIVFAAFFCCALLVAPYSFIYMQYLFVLVFHF